MEESLDNVEDLLYSSFYHDSVLPGDLPALNPNDGDSDANSVSILHNDEGIEAKRPEPKKEVSLGRKPLSYSDVVRQTLKEKVVVVLDKSDESSDDEVQVLEPCNEEVHWHQQSDVEVWSLSSDVESPDEIIEDDGEGIGTVVLHEDFGGNCPKSHDATESSILGSQ